MTTTSQSIGASTYKNPTDTAWMRGWDTGLHGDRQDPNPYRRRDFHRAFERGRSACINCEPLPAKFSWPNKPPVELGQ